MSEVTATCFAGWKSGTLPCNLDVPCSMAALALSWGPPTCVSLRACLMLPRHRGYLQTKSPTRHAAGRQKRAGGQQGHEHKKSNKACPLKRSRNRSHTETKPVQNGKPFAYGPETHRGNLRTKSPTRHVHGKRLEDRSGPRDNKGMNTKSPTRHVH